MVRIAEDLGVGLSSLTRWIGQYRSEEMPSEITNDLQAELTDPTLVAAST
jgi:transposase